MGSSAVNAHSLARKVHSCADRRCCTKLDTFTFRPVMRLIEWLQTDSFVVGVSHHRCLCLTVYGHMAKNRLLCWKEMLQKLLSSTHEWIEGNYILVSFYHGLKSASCAQYFHTIHFYLGLFWEGFLKPFLLMGLLFEWQTSLRHIPSLTLPLLSLWNEIFHINLQYNSTTLLWDLSCFISSAPFLVWNAIHQSEECLSNLHSQLYLFP